MYCRCICLCSSAHSCHVFRFRRTERCFKVQICSRVSSVVRRLNCMSPACLRCCSSTCLVHPACLHSSCCAVAVQDGQSKGPTLFMPPSAIIRRTHSVFGRSVRPSVRPWSNRLQKVREYDILQTACSNFTKFTNSVKTNRLDFGTKKPKVYV